VMGVRRWRELVIEKNGEVLFDRPKPTAGCSANGRRRRRRRRNSSINITQSNIALFIFVARTRALASVTRFRITQDGQCIRTL
jgi:hypothetical protein